MRHKKEKKGKKKRGQEGVVIVMSALIGAACAILGEEHLRIFLPKDEMSYQPLIGLVIALYAVMMIQVAVHEAGHLVFGLLTGYRFSSYRIGGFIWIRVNGKIRFKRLSIAGTGGQCLMVPPDMIEGQIPFLLYNFGGAIFNLLSAVLFYLVYRLAGDNAFVSSFSVISIVIAVILALTNAIPLQMGSINNDGHNARTMAKKKEEVRGFWTQLKVNAETADGVRMRDMPDEWFVLPEAEDLKNSQSATIGVLACVRVLDQHRFEEARQRMEEFLEMETGIVGLHKGQLIGDIMYCELIGAGRTERVEELLDKTQKKYMKAMRSYPPVLRTQYAYARLQEKDEQKAEKLLAQFEKVGRSYPYPNEIACERELIEIVKEKATTEAQGSGIENLGNYMKMNRELR